MQEIKNESSITMQEAWKQLTDYVRHYEYCTKSHIETLELGCTCGLSSVLSALDIREWGT